MITNKRKTVLITGAGGFLGSNTYNRLKKENFELLLFTSQKEKFQSADKNVIAYDNSDWEKGNIPFHTIDTIINCAFARSSDPVKIAESIEFTNDFIGQAVAEGTRSVINISSQSVYDQKRIEEADESSAVKPESLYGMAKFAVEILISRICSDFSVPFTNIRMGSIVGNELEARMTNRFVKRGITGENIYITGGHQIISYLHITDAADAVASMLKKDSSEWKSIYNLGNDEKWTLMELADLVKEQLMLRISRNVEIRREDGGDYHNISLDSSRFYDDFGWGPQYTMSDILSELIDHYKDLRNS